MKKGDILKPAECTIDYVFDPTLRHKVLDTYCGGYRERVYVLNLDTGDKSEMLLCDAEATFDVCKYEEEREWYNRDKVFKTIIECQINANTCLYAPNPPAVPISNILMLNKGMTLYGAKKALQWLVKKGLVQYVSVGRPAIVSEGESHELVSEARPPLNGYILTQTGFESFEYKDAYREWDRILADIEDDEEDDLDD